MSTNQLAFVISDLQDIEPREVEIDEMDGRKLQVKVWSRKEFMESLVDVPDKVARIVNYLQKYFNGSIGLPKLDLMAIPMYSASKASDSWGLMFFKYVHMTRLPYLVRLLHGGAHTSCLHTRSIFPLSGRANSAARWCGPQLTRFSISGSANPSLRSVETTRRSTRPSIRSWLP